MGAYIGAVGANIQTVNLARCLPGMYDIKLIDMATRCVFTNTVHDRRPIAAPAGRKRTTCSNG